MSDEIRIKTKADRIDNRANIFLGRRNLGKQISKVVMIMSRDSPTEVMFVMKPKSVEVEAKAIKSEDVLSKIIDRFLKGKGEISGK